MREICKYLDIEYEDAPLMSHGKQLDRVFLSSRSEELLLMDSDAELMDPTPIDAVYDSISSNAFFGAGFVQNSGWMAATELPHYWYMARMWLPFCAIKVGVVCNLLKEGLSFQHRKVYNDFPAIPLIAKSLAIRHRIPFLKSLPLAFLDRFRKPYAGVKPHVIYFDTGADIYRGMLGKGYQFSEQDWRVVNSSIKHHHGVTRSRLALLRLNAAGTSKPFTYARRRLATEYSDLLPDHLHP